MRQYNVKTLPDNLAAAIKIVSEAIRRRQECVDSLVIPTDGKKTLAAREASHRQPSAIK